MVISKIKNMLSHDEVVTQLQTTIQESVAELKKLQSTVQSQQEENQKLLDQVKELSKDHKKLSKQFEETQNELQSAQKKLSRVTGELALFKPALEKELLNDFKQTIESELAVVTKDLKFDADAHTKAQDLFEKTLSQQESLLEQITKLQEVTKGIDAKDFELSKHAKQLHLKDQEKLRLMKRVDDLEKLLAKMKTRRN